MLGNVFEWVADPWHPNYEGAPQDGSVWASTDGRFLMGSPPPETQGLAREDAERVWFEREQPRHAVTLTTGFWLFDTPCTRALWEAVMGSKPSRFKSADRPVEQVSWDDAQGFVARINARVPGLGLTLPTEAQWEYACRAGTETALYTGPIQRLGANHAPALDSIAWYGGNSGVGTPTRTRVRLKSHLH